MSKRKFFSLVFIILLALVTMYIFNSDYKKVDASKNIKDALSSSKNEPVSSSLKEIKQEDKVYSLSFIAAGDALIHGAIYKAAYKNNTYDFKPMISLVKPIVEQYDLAFYNQETIFAGAEIGYSHYPRFNTPSEYGDAMLDAGFNIVATANNHSYDKGETGVINAINYWSNTDVLWQGINDSFEMQNNIPIMTKNNITYALLAYTTLNNGLKTPVGKEYLVNYYSDEKVKSDVEQIRDKVDVIIVSMHWGTEYSSIPNASQKAIVDTLVNLNVDIVVGHHPHVLQGIEKINNTLVMYSLGNFISAQVGTKRLTGALVSLNITKTISETGTKISLSTPAVELIYTAKNSNYTVVPFSQIENKYLTNSQDVYNEGLETITSLDKNIVVAPLKQN